MTRVHVRYEHPTSTLPIAGGRLSTASHPFAAGVTLAMLTSVSVDEHGVEVSPAGGGAAQEQQATGTDAVSATSVVRKAMELRRLAVYMDTDTPPWDVASSDATKSNDVSAGEWDALFGPGIEDDNEQQASPSGRARQYVLAPTSGTLRLTRAGGTSGGDASLNPSSAQSHGGSGSGAQLSQMQVDLSLGDVAVALSTAQCRDAARLSATLSEAASASRHAQRQAFDAERTRLALSSIAALPDVAETGDRNGADAPQAAASEPPPREKPRRGASPATTRLWWRYAVTLAMASLSAHHRRGSAEGISSWRRIAAACHARRQYLALYKGVASAQHPDIARLDASLPFEVALLFRCLAHVHGEQQRAAAVQAAAAARAARRGATPRRSSGTALLTRGAGYALRTAAGLMWRRNDSGVGGGGGPSDAVPLAEDGTPSTPGAGDDSEPAFADAMDSAVEEEESSVAVAAEADAEEDDDTFHDVETSIEALEAAAEAQAAAEAAAAGPEASASSKQESSLMSPEDWAQLDNLIASTSSISGATASAGGAQAPSPDALLAQLRVSCASAALTLHVSPEHDISSIAAASSSSRDGHEHHTQQAPLDATLHLTCAGFAGTARVYPGRHDVSLALRQWRVVTPEGVLVRSSTRDGHDVDDTPSFEVTYAKLTPGGRFDHALSATLLPIAVTASRAAVERLVTGARAASAAVASALAAEQQSEVDEPFTPNTRAEEFQDAPSGSVPVAAGDLSSFAAAAASAAARARAAAAARLAAALASPPRVRLALDVGAPQLLLPISVAPERDGRPPFVMAVNLGRFQFRSVGEDGNEQHQSTQAAADEHDEADTLLHRAPEQRQCEVFELTGRDMEVFFAPPGFTWEDNQTAAPTDTNPHTLHVLRRVAFVAMAQVTTPAAREAARRNTDGPKAPDVRVRVAAPCLDWELSPARYWHCLDSIREMNEAVQAKRMLAGVSASGAGAAGGSPGQQSLGAVSVATQRPWTKAPPLAPCACDVLVHGAGGLRHTWLSSLVAHSGAYLYILDSLESNTHRQAVRLGSGIRISAVPPSAVGGEPHCVTACDVSLPPAQAPTTRRALVLRFSDGDTATRWMRVLRAANTRLSGAASRPAALGLLDLGMPNTNVQAPPSAALAAGVSPISTPGGHEAGGTPAGHNEAAAEDSHVRLDIVASVGRLTLRVGARPQALAGRGAGHLGAAPSPPPPSWGASDEALIVVWHGQAGVLTWTHSAGSATASLRLGEFTIHDLYCGGLQLCSAATAAETNSSDEHAAEKWQDDAHSATSTTDDAVLRALLPSEEVADDPQKQNPFAVFTLRMCDVASSQYGGTDASLEVALTAVALDLRRPTLASLWRCKDDTLGVPAANERELLQARAATLGEHKGRVLLHVGIAMRGASLTLWGTPAWRLSRIEATDLAVDARVFPTSLAVSASLGGLRVANLKLAPDHPHHVLLDAKAPAVASDGSGKTTSSNLVRFELRNFAPDDPEACGRDYWLVASAAGVRLVYLHCFADEVSSWFVGTLPPNPRRAPAAPPPRSVLASGARPKLAIHVDATFEAPIIVLPRGTRSSDSVEFDLGHATWRTSFAWMNGTCVHDAGAVLLERTDMELTGMRLTCILNGHRGLDATKNGRLAVTLWRPLWDPGASVPLYDVSVLTPALALAIDDAEYLLLYGVLGANLSEQGQVLPRLVPLPDTAASAAQADGSSAVTTPRSSGTVGGAFGPSLPPPVAPISPDGSPRATLRLAWRAPEATLQLFHAPRASAARPLATMALRGFATCYRADSSGGWSTRWSFPQVSFRDARASTPSDLRDVIGATSRVTDAAAGGKASAESAADGQPTVWFMELGVTPGASLPGAAQAPQPPGGTGPGVFRLKAGLQRVQFLFDPEFVLAVGRFFVPSLRPGLADAVATSMARDIQVVCTADAADGAIVTRTSECAPITKAPASRVALSPAQRLLADAPGGEDEVVYDGGGGILILPPTQQSAQMLQTAGDSIATSTPLILVGAGRTLRLRNVTLVRAYTLDAHARLAPGARICAEVTDGVVCMDEEPRAVFSAAADQSPSNAAAGHQATGGSVSAQRRDVSIEVSATGLQLLLPESGPLGGGSQRGGGSGANQRDAAHVNQHGAAHADASSRRALRACLDIHTAWRRAGQDSLSVTSHVQHLSLWVQYIAQSGGRAAGSASQHDLTAALTAAAGPSRAPTALLAPTDVLARVRIAGGTASAVVDATDVEARVSLRTLALCARIGGDALELFSGVAASSTRGLTAPTAAFDLVWSSPGAGRGGPGAAGQGMCIWRPRAAEGYAPLGDIVTVHGVTPPRQVTTLHDGCGLAEAPLSFTQVWSSTAASASCAGPREVTVWRPVAPPGFAALGCVASLGPSPPPRGAVRCVRTSALTRALLGECVYMVAAGNTPSAAEGSLWCVNNGACTFWASRGLDPPERGPLADVRSPLEPAPLTASSTSSATAAPAAQQTPSPFALSLPASRDQSQAVLPTAHAVEFVRIWWDKGAQTRRKLSLWRPVAPQGFIPVGDAAVDGHEPPRVAVVVADIPGATARPVGFEPLWSSARSRCPEAVSFWAPVPPTGYVSLGHVASRSLSVPPGPACCACVRADLVDEARTLMAEPLWAEDGTSSKQRVLVWPLDTNTHTWKASPGRARPQGSIHRVRLTSAAPPSGPSQSGVGRPGGAPSQGSERTSGPHSGSGPPMHADIRMARVSLLLLQPGAGGAASPLAAVTAHALHCDVAGDMAASSSITAGTVTAPPSRRALASATVGVHVYNARVRAWEAAVEPAEVAALVERSGKRNQASVTVTSPLNVTVSASAADTFMSAISRERAVTAALAARRADAQSGVPSQSLFGGGDESSLIGSDVDLEEDVGAHTVFENTLGRPLYLRYEAPATGRAGGGMAVVELTSDAPRAVAHAWRGATAPVALPAWWMPPAEVPDMGPYPVVDDGTTPPPPPPPGLASPRRLCVRVRCINGPAADAAAADPAGRPRLSVQLELKLPSDTPQQVRTAGCPPTRASSIDTAASCVTWNETFLLALPRVNGPDGLMPLLSRCVLTVSVVDDSAEAGAGAEVACTSLSVLDAMHALHATGGDLTLEPAPGAGVRGKPASLQMSLSIDDGAADAPAAPSQPEVVTSGVDSGDGGAAVEVVHIALSLHGPWAPLAVTNLRGRTLLTLVAPGGGESGGAAVETDLRAGVRHITVRPMVRVHNATGVPLALALAPATGPASGVPSSQQQQQPAVVEEEEAFEQERYIPFSSAWSSDALFTTDGAPFCSRTGVHGPGGATLGAYLAAARVVLPEGWAWLGDWNVDASAIGGGSVDAQGWSYASGSDAGTFSYPFPEGGNMPGAMDYVRRRRWVRRRSKMAGLTLWMSHLAPGATLAVPHVSGSAVPHSSLRLHVRPLVGSGSGATLEEFAWGRTVSPRADGIIVSATGFGSHLIGCTAEGAHWLVCSPAGAYAAEPRCQSFWLGVRATAQPLSPAHGDWMLTLSPPLVVENTLPRPVSCHVWERTSGGAMGAPPQLVPRAAFAMPPCSRRAVHSADPRAPLFMEVLPQGGRGGQAEQSGQQQQQAGSWRSTSKNLACISHGSLSANNADIAYAQSPLPPLATCVRLADSTTGTNLWIELHHVGGRMPHTLRCSVPFAVRNGTGEVLTLAPVPMPARGGDGFGDDAGDDDFDIAATLAVAAGAAAEQLRVVSTRTWEGPGGAHMAAPSGACVLRPAKGRDDEPGGGDPSLVLVSPAPPRNTYAMSLAGQGYPQRWGLVLGVAGVGSAPPLRLDLDSLERSATLINAFTPTGSKIQLVVRLANSGAAAAGGGVGAVPSGASEGSPPSFGVSGPQDMMPAFIGGEDPSIGSRTRVITVSYHVTLANASGVPLFLRQLGTPDATPPLELPPGGVPVPLVWPAAGRPERLQLRTSQSQWSCPFGIAAIDGESTFIRLRGISNSQLESASVPWLMRLSCSMRPFGGGASAVLSRSDVAPVLVRNASPLPLRVRQALASPLGGSPHTGQGVNQVFRPVAHASAQHGDIAAAQWQRVPPYSCISFAWDRCMDPRVVEVGGEETFGGETPSVLYRLGTTPAPPPQYGAGGAINISGPSAEAGRLHSGVASTPDVGGTGGPLPVLTVTPSSASAVSLRGTVLNSGDTDDDVTILRLAPVQANNHHMPALAATSASLGGTEYTLSLDVPDATLSLCDAGPEELLLLSLVGLHVEHSAGVGGGECATTRVRLRRCQVDDMSPFTFFPVALYTRPIQDSSAGGGDDLDNDLGGSLPPGSASPGQAQGNDGTTEESFMDVTLTERLPRPTGGDARSRSFPYLGIKLATHSELVVRLSEATLWRCAQLLSRIAGAMGGNAPGGQDAGMGWGSVRADMPILVSLLSVSHLALRLSIRTAPDSAAASGPGSGPNLIQSLGLTLANVDEAVLELQPVVLEGVHARGHAALWRLLLGHASRQLRGQVLRLLQGVDVLDNVSNALGVASAGVAALSLDPTFSARRRGALGGDSRPRVATIGDGLRDGGEALARSLLRGVTGLLTKPVEGARREGVEGFLKGVGKGLLGAATQPMSGVLDLVSSTTAGLSASWDTVAAVLSDERTHARRRLPRAVRTDGILRPYNAHSAVGQHILRLATASSGGSGSALGLDMFLRARGAARTDTYEGHVEDLPGRRIAMVTNRRLMLLVRPEEEHDLLEDPCTALWHAEWRDILAVEIHRLRGEPNTALPSVLVVHLKRSHMRRGGGDSTGGADLALGGGSSSRSSFAASLLFDGDPSRQLRRLVRCTPGTGQAARLARLIASARQRAAAASDASGAGGGSMPGLIPRVASSMLRSGSSGDLLGAGHADGWATGALGPQERNIYTDDDAIASGLNPRLGDDGGGGGDAFDLEALALGTGDADIALRDGGGDEDDDGLGLDDVDVDAAHTAVMGDDSTAAVASAIMMTMSPTATPPRRRDSTTSVAGGNQGGAGQSVLSSPSMSTDGGPPALPCTGFTRLWCSRGAEGDAFRPVSLWRPLAPSGYYTLGDVAQTGYDPPVSPVAVYRGDDPALAPPLGYVLVWRDTGSGAHEHVTIWAPQPPPGFAALGCVAVSGDSQPGIDAVRCVAMDRTYSSHVFDDAVWRDAGRPGGWRCSLWQVDNDAGTFLARRDHVRPGPGAALGALLY